MKPEIAREWAKALRSGVYTQGRGTLHTLLNWGAMPPEHQFCCLGVLCELAIQDGVEIVVENPNAESVIESHYAYNGRKCLLPYAVREWAGMKTPEGCFVENQEQALELESLTGLNDLGRNFLEIADIIEQQVDQL